MANHARTGLFPILLLLGLAFGGGPALADDRVPMQDDPKLESGLRTVAVAHVMRKRCDEITLRKVRSYLFAKGLKDHASSLGYTDAEIEAYFEDEDHKARVTARARAYLESLGVDFDDDQSFCTVAKAEIAKERDFGRYFRVR